MALQQTCSKFLYKLLLKTCSIELKTPVFYGISSICSNRRLSNDGFDKTRKKVRVTHIIFDLDGTMLDNQQHLDDAFEAVFQKYGKEYTTDWRLKLMGMTGRAMWEKVAHELRVDADWRNMYEDYKRITSSANENVSLRPGVERLIHHLYKHYVPMAIATSSTRSTFEVKTSCVSQFVMEKITHVVCGGDDRQVTQSKPCGQIFTVCASRFLDKPKPRRCLVFEDSPVGVCAALDAGMQVVGIPAPPTPPGALIKADEVLETFVDFQPEKYGLPSFCEEQTEQEDSKKKREKTNCNMNRNQ